VGGRRASHQQVQIIGANKVSEYFGPVGTMCVNTWHVATLDGRHLHVSGLLVFTNNGTALVWADHDATSLRLGLAARFGRRNEWRSFSPEGRLVSYWMKLLLPLVFVAVAREAGRCVFASARCELHLVFTSARCVLHPLALCYITVTGRVLTGLNSPF
jgi:hypothetical protein